MSDEVAYLGDQGEHITELQQRLSETGYQVEVTGNFDLQTQEALNSFAVSQSMPRDRNTDAIIALQSATGALEHNVWQNQLAPQPPMEYGHTRPVGSDYAGEEQPGNKVWTRETDVLKQTYYPSDATASDEYGMNVQGGRVTIPGEVDAEGNPVYLDTTDITHGTGLAGTKDERMIYTMGEDGEMRLGGVVAEEGDRGLRFHHSSLAAGQEVAGAGEMKVREGTVESVSDRSGHYTPDLGMTQQVEQRLSAGGVDTSRVTFELGNYDENKTQSKPDTLVTAAELGAYDEASTIAQLQRECLAKVDGLGRAKWSNAWSMMDVTNPAKKEQERTLLYNELWAGIEAKGEQGLYKEARRMLEERHDQKRQLLAEIANSWGWREDPLERYDYRWYDGKNWTSRVARNEQEYWDEESAAIFDEDSAVRGDMEAQKDAAARAEAERVRLEQERLLQEQRRKQAAAGLDSRGYAQDSQAFRGGD